jgi:hypothetical protein
VKVFPTNFDLQVWLHPQTTAGSNYYGTGSDTFQCGSPVCDIVHSFRLSLTSTEFDSWNSCANTTTVPTTCLPNLLLSGPNGLLGTLIVDDAHYWFNFNNNFTVKPSPNWNLYTNVLWNVFPTFMNHTSTTTLVFNVGSTFDNSTVKCARYEIPNSSGQQYTVNKYAFVFYFDCAHVNMHATVF